MGMCHRIMILLSMVIICSVGATGEENFTLTSNHYMINENNGYQIITMDGYHTHGSPGNPLLPSKTYNILLPSNCNLSTVKLEIVEIDGNYLNGSFNIPPAPPMITDGKNGTIIEYGVGKKIVNGYNVNVYDNNSLYPKEPVYIVNKGQLREAKLVCVKFTPLQYNPVEKRIYQNKKVIFKISYNLNNMDTLPSSSIDNIGEEYDISPYTANLLKNYDVLNPNEISSANSVLSNADTPSYDYVIITTNEIKNNSIILSNFVDYLKNKSFNPLIITEDDYGNDTGQKRAINIRNWLKNHYQLYGIKYVLLIGNPDPDDPEDDFDTYGDIPMMMCYPRYYDNSDRETPTDYFYADLTGDWDSNENGIYGDPYDDIDFYADVFVGRIPTYNNDCIQLDAILGKIIFYGNSYGDWRRKVLMPMAISNYDNEDGYGSYRTDGRDLPKYLIENILQPLNYSYYVMYERSGLDAVPTSAPYYNAPINKTNVINEWNNGYGLVLWWGHGGSDGAYRKYWESDNDEDGIPDNNEMKLEDFMSSSDIANLSDFKPTITYQCSCLNGYPEYSDNLGYSLLKNGAVATVSASRVSWYTPGLWSPDGSPDNAEIGYEFAKEVTMGYPVGDALYLAKSMFATYDNELKMNLMDFNLYGDPSLKLNENITFNQTFVINKLPYTIVLPGHYILNTSCSNLNETAITILSSDVILEGNKHVLAGDSSYQDIDGICVLNSNNILINNLTVLNWSSGVYFENVKYCMLSNINSELNEYGIYIDWSCSDNILRNNTMHDNKYNFVSYDTYNDIDTSNTVNGKPIYYLINKSDEIIDSSTNAGTVCLIDCNNITVRDLNLTQNGFGVLLSGTNNSKIENIKALNNIYGIVAVNSNNNIVCNSIASSNEYYGVLIGETSNCTLENISSELNYYGISIEYGYSKNILRNNTMYNNIYNFMSWDSDYNDIDTSNTVNGKPIYYLINESDEIIDSSTNAGTVYLIDCNNITIRDLNLTQNGYGIFLKGTDDSKIENISALNNGVGVKLENSNNNLLNCLYVGLNKYGVELEYLSNNNVLMNSTLSYNYECGLVFNWDTNNNTAYLNNFIDNMNNIYIAPYSQNTPYSSEVINYTYNGSNYLNYLGNYYTNYNGTDGDGDGIGDTPYFISDDYNYLLNKNNISVDDGIKLLKINMEDISSNEANSNDTILSEEIMADYYPLIDPKEYYTPHNSIIPAKKPDLTITYYQVPLNPFVNSTYIISANIDNIGDMNASSFNVVLRDNGYLIDTKTVDSLDINEDILVIFEWTPTTVGYHDLSITVDDNNTVDELDELNNEISKEVYVNAPIAPITVKMYPNNISCGEGESFNISLSLVDVPLNMKCGGFETLIQYDKSILQLTNIELSNISNDADLKLINTSSGLISLLWESNPPSGNFTIATLTFNAVSIGYGDVVLNETILCDENGTKYSNVIVDNMTYIVSNPDSIILKKGWNAISLPHKNNISFSNESNVVQIITYYNNSWELHRENNLKVLYGYYIYCKNDTVMYFTFDKSEPYNPPARTVYKGYNLVAINPSTNDYEDYYGKVKLSDYVLSINDTWTQILDLDGHIYNVYDNISNVYLDPYKIYWLAMNEDDELMGRNVY